MSITEYLRCPQCNSHFLCRKELLVCSHCENSYELKGNLVNLSQAKDRTDAPKSLLSEQAIVLVGSGAESIIKEAEEKLIKEFAVSNIYTVKGLKDLLGFKTAKGLPVVFISDLANNFTLLKSIGFLKFLKSPKYTYRLGAVLSPLSANSISCK